MEAAAPLPAVAGSSTTTSAFEPAAATQPAAVKKAVASSKASDAQSGSHSKAPSVNTFVHPPERHISVDPYELKMSVKSRLELADREHFDNLTKLMEGVANFDFYDLKQRMRKSFLPFSSGARNDIYLQRSSKALPTTDTLDTKEAEFIQDVYEVLAASHYTLLTKEEWDLATSENFNLNLPMEVNWKYMDQKLLEKFWQSSDKYKAMRTTLPDCMADSILVFHRGIGSERVSGMLIDQKLDLLMDYTVFHILDMIKAPFKKKKEDSDKAAAAATGAQPASAVQPVGDAAQHLNDAAISQYEFEDGVMIASRHRYAKRVERETLARQCPTLLTLLKSFPMSMSLQEPTFKDLVVVYRRKLPERKPPTAAANAPNKNKDERLQGILQHRNINIKVFGETPMADVEIIFPDKVVGIKPFQLVNLAITVITALVGGAMVMWKAQNINMNIVWTAISLVLTRCFAVYTQAQTQRTMLQQQMTSSLYDKMQDSQEGVISVITEELSDQQLKQMLLAYMVLIVKGRAMKKDDLDTACEEFLMKEFDHPIDYDLESALPRLQGWGLITIDAQGKLVAKPMTEAISVLEQAWAIAYKEIGKDGSKVATIDMITGKASVFKDGIEQYQKTRRAEQDSAAAADAAKKAGIMGKAKNVFGGKDKAGTAGGVAPLAANGLDASAPTTGPHTPTPDPAYSSGGAYSSAGPHSPDIAAGESLHDDVSTQGSSAGGAPGIERKKSSSLKGMFKKLKA